MICAPNYNQSNISLTKIAAQIRVMKSLENQGLD